MHRARSLRLSTWVAFLASLSFAITATATASTHAGRWKWLTDQMVRREFIGELAPVHKIKLLGSVARPSGTYKIYFFYQEAGSHGQHLLVVVNGRHRVIGTEDIADEPSGMTDTCVLYPAKGHPDCFLPIPRDWPHKGPFLWGEE
jgi:hypothetical protein